MLNVKHMNTHSTHMVPVNLIRGGDVMGRIRHEPEVFFCM
jgi:hypothetical protein